MDNKVTPLRPVKQAPPETTNADFLADVSARIETQGADKLLVISLQDSNDEGQYIHSLYSNNIKATEIVALLELVKQTVISRM